MISRFRSAGKGNASASFIPAKEVSFVSIWCDRKSRSCRSGVFAVRMPVYVLFRRDVGKPGQKDGQNTSNGETV
jgi:hypothetical protein